MTTDNLQANKTQINQTEIWFDEMVQNLRYDQMLLETEIIGKEKKDIYNAFITGDQDFLHNYARQNSSNYFITKMVDFYFKDLIKTKSKPCKIALELSNSKILVWVEIKDEDEIMENALILAEAKINSLFYQYGYHISSTIVESSDGLTVPEHYKNVVIS